MHHGDKEDKVVDKLNLGLGEIFKNPKQQLKSLNNHKEKGIADIFNKPTL